MKSGDLVRFTLHSRSGLIQPSGLYLVLRRDAQNMYKKYDDDSKWAAWHIMDSTTGKRYTEIGRDIEVICESG